MLKHEWKNHFATLDKRDRKDPFRVLEFFTEQDHLFGIRAKYYEVFTAAMNSEDFSNDTPRDKANLMWLLRVTIQLAEAAFLIEEMIETEQLTYSINKSK